MHDSSSLEIKALLTLALLKSGTSAKDIQTAVNVAAAARLMVAEEYAELNRVEESPSGGNVTSLLDVRHGTVTTNAVLREPQVMSLNSDIKALLSLLLLQHGATQSEIVTTLRMATAARVISDEAPDVEQAVGENPRPAPAPAPDAHQFAPKPKYRNDFLSPATKAARAA